MAPGTDCKRSGGIATDAGAPPPVSQLTGRAARSAALRASVVRLRLGDVRTISTADPAPEVAARASSNTADWIEDDASVVMALGVRQACTQQIEVHKAKTEVCKAYVELQKAT